MYRVTLPPVKRVTVLGVLSPFLGGQKAGRNIRTLEGSKEALPRCRLAGKDNVARLRVAPDIDLGAIETVFGRQANRLAAAILEQLGDM
jgi:hypothetical protein